MGTCSRGCSSCSASGRFAPAGPLPARLVSGSYARRGDVGGSDSAVPQSRGWFPRRWIAAFCRHPPNPRRGRVLASTRSSLNGQADSHPSWVTTARRHDLSSCDIAYAACRPANARARVLIAHSRYSTHFPFLERTSQTSSPETGTRLTQPGVLRSRALSRSSRQWMGR